MSSTNNNRRVTRNQHKRQESNKMMLSASSASAASDRQPNTRPRVSRQSSANKAKLEVSKAIGSATAAVDLEKSLSVLNQAQAHTSQVIDLQE